MVPANNVRVALVNEGIVSVNNLAEFRKNHWHQVVTNLKYPASFPDPDNNGKFIRSPTITLGVKSLERLKVASEAARYYEAIGRTLTPGNMNFTTTLRTLELQWQSLCDHSDGPLLSVPNITRNVKVVKWASSMQDFWGTVIGFRKSPLTYIVREIAKVTMLPPPLVPNRPYSEEHGSVEWEMIAQLSYEHPVFDDDNATCFNHL